MVLEEPAGYEESRRASQRTGGLAGLAVGALAALADAFLAIATDPHRILGPSAAGVLFRALVIYPPLWALAGYLVAGHSLTVTRRLGSLRRSRRAPLGVMVALAVLLVGASWIRYTAPDTARWLLVVESAAVLAGVVVSGTLLARLGPRQRATRRHVGLGAFVWLALVAALGGGSLLAPGPWTHSGANGPSIILITVDTLRADALGCYGNTSAETPNIDRLAAEGARFTNAMAQSSWTLTGHASIMTGLTVGQHGADAATLHLSETKTTIATMLRRQGYRTAAVVSSLYTGSRFGLEQGFEVFDEEMSPPWLALSACRVLRRLGIAPRSWDPAFERRAGIVDSAAVRFLGRNRENVFFLWLHYFDPHSDYDPPPPFAARARAAYAGSFDGTTTQMLDVNRGLRRIGAEDVRHLRALYDGEVAYLDSELGALRVAIERLGLADRTAIVLTADHGEAFLEHGTLLHESLHQEVLHVPLLLWRPGLVPGGSVVNVTVRQMDVAPSVAELAGMAWNVPESAALSLLPLARGAREPLRVARADRQVGGLGRAITGEQHALIEWPWKLIVKTAAEPELYNLRDDPAERSNLAPAEGARVHAMAAAIESERGPKRPAPVRPDAWVLRALRSLGYLN